MSGVIDGVILVVEDDPTLQRVATWAIGHLGYQCQTVRVGEEAVEQYPDGFSLIFMDIGLPGISGIDAALSIREKERKARLKRTPIIALTGHADRQRCLNSDMDDFLQKPALLADLKRMIDKWLPVGN